MKLGIVGNGMVVKSLLEALEEIPDVKVKALCVRRGSLSQGRMLADSYHIREIYTEYPVFLTRTDIDTVYIGIISSLHYEYARMALLAGKHVICEKPFTTEYDEAWELIRMPRSRSCFSGRRARLTAQRISLR